MTIANKYIYDHIGRKLKTWEQITNGALTPDTNRLVSQLAYNEIGQVKTKSLHSKDSINFLQNIAYTYNERGWLLGSNAPLFRMQLYYNTASVSKAYNGNIMYQYWGSTLASRYAYTYDKLNRLTAGATLDNYKEYPGYDLQGNITSMSRYQAGTAIDLLLYTYTSGGNPTNQLQSINDQTTSDVGLKHGISNFTYDGNGNMITDPTKGATGITIGYNLLNLPQSISGSKTITYTYDAGGNKLRKNSTTANNITDYISGIQYDGVSTPALSFIQTEEGKAVPNGTGYNYVYYLGDNLGNTRITFETKTGAAVQVQQDDYYPFGMEINTSVTSPKNEYLYNKKELQEELQEYDYGARFYDPVIARWNTPDLLAELSYNWTPYRYCYNNPINYIDPYGLWESNAGGYTTTDPKDIERFTNYQQTENAMNVKPNITQISSFVKEEKAGGLGRLTDGSKLLNPIKVLRYNMVGGETGYKVNKKSFSNFWHQVQGDLTPDALDPRTIGQNWVLGSTYAGPNNPKSYNGTDNYDYKPSDQSEVQAFNHDKDFDKLGLKGPMDVFNNPKAQAANVRLVNSEVGVVFSLKAGPLAQARALIVVLGIGAADLYNVASNTVSDVYHFHPYK